MRAGSRQCLIHSQAWISSISQSSAATVDSNRDTTDHVARSDQQSRPEQRVSSVVVGARVHGIPFHQRHLRTKNNGHNDAVDGDDLAEDDGNEVLGSYPWRLDTTADDGGSGDEDSPV